jgi:hypothetical protein
MRRVARWLPHSCFVLAAGAASVIVIRAHHWHSGLAPSAASPVFVGDSLTALCDQLEPPPERYVLDTGSAGRWCHSMVEDVA